MMSDSVIAVRAVRRIAIPSRHPRHHAAHRGTRHAADAFGAEVLVELVPRIPHRREAVAEVRHAAGAHDRFHRAVAHADDGVEAIEIELLDGGWEDRQILAVVAARPW